MWDWSYAVEILPELLRGLQITVLATFGGFAFACIGGLVMALAVSSRWKVISVCSRFCLEFIRNTPLLVQVFFLYYTLPKLMNISLSAFAVGIIGLGLHYSTYLSEVYRSGIQAVPRGQWEAAVALNYPKVKTWTTIILPQAIPPVIPIMGNYLIVMFKETPILSAITLVEMLLTAKNIVSQSYRVFEPYTLVGILFLLISYPASLLVQRLEKRLSLQVKQAASSSAVQDKRPTSERGVGA
ncbi:ectoine/hydroxyectoine ABC transporter permease subunit EhuD [Paenibacillus sp. GD4]|uniref:ectoine/hydroxyectoine ABC transporter permease subunit EhuD n=1 Tax=Paenibacillus sp. GD4 TaxID=3068890 RepID=UPI0027963EB9|nr:ectoine/hydroxyectoine ABC transporter permease subunit EhuD [Paenibacillus sp. GD4]MDQ1911943.1 ectoine/hydroxyectoine ABC transporter permease subunit EhuD [Paenibacillus sp. GD4]